MKEVSDMKTTILREVDKIRESLIEIADKIHSNPELGNEEYEAAEILSKELEKYGFEIERGIIGLPTAFRASFEGKKDGIVIAFLAEYDALPEIGHACGHNLIGTMGIGAAIALSKIMRNLPGKIIVLGSPAEETSGAKVAMVNKGVFDNVDIAMMVHPSDSNSILNTSLAMNAIEFKYKGKVAQAAIAPWDGINALDGVIQLFVAVNALRLRLEPDIRVHGIIEKGGVAANIIPDEAIAKFYIRGPERLKVNEAIDSVVKCAEGAAIATQTTLSIRDYEESFENMIPNVTMANTFYSNLKALGVNEISQEFGIPFGSTDMGNVSHKVPSIHPNLAIASKGTKTHSHEFTQAAASSQAHEALVLGAKAQALTGFDILTNPILYDQIKKEFNEKIKK